VIVKVPFVIAAKTIKCHQSNRIGTASIYWDAISESRKRRSQRRKDLSSSWRGIIQLISHLFSLIFGFALPNFV